MVFNVDPNGSFSNTNNDGRYKVFQAFGNDTGARMDSFRVTLGTGVGTNFVSSTANDGLSVVQSFGGKPLNNSQFSALFSNGLFGPQDEPQHPLIGYFSNDRTGFNLEFDGTDSFVFDRDVRRLRVACSGRCCPTINCRRATSLTMTGTPTPTTC